MIGEIFLEYLLIPLLVVGFFAWFFWSARKDKVRLDAEMATFGQKHGLRKETFTVDIHGPRTVDYGPLWPDLTGFFMGGENVTIRRVWRGPWNKGEVRLFEYSRSNGEGGRAILFDSPVFDLPPFVVLPYAHHRGAVEGVTPMRGVPVVARDAIAVDRLFTPEVAAFFKDREEGKRTFAEGRGTQLMYFKLLAPPPPRKFHPPDVAVDLTNEGFWESGEKLARLMASGTGAAL